MSSSSIFACHGSWPLSASVLSRALLRLTAKHRPGHALQRGGLLLPLSRRLTGFGSPAILRTGAPAALHAFDGSPEKAALGFGSGPARFSVPREDLGSRKGEPEMFVNR